MGQYLTDNIVTTHHLKVTVTSYVSTTQQKPTLVALGEGNWVGSKLIFHCIFFSAF